MTPTPKGECGNQNDIKAKLLNRELFNNNTRSLEKQKHCEVQVLFPPR